MTINRLTIKTKTCVAINQSVRTESGPHSLIRRVPPYLATPSEDTPTWVGSVCHSSVVFLLRSIILILDFCCRMCLKRCPKGCGTIAPSGCWIQLCFAASLLSYSSRSFIPLSISSRFIPRYFRVSSVDS